jgi:hypothetical protein
MSSTRLALITGKSLCIAAKTDLKFEVRKNPLVLLHNYQQSMKFLDNLQLVPMPKICPLIVTILESLSLIKGLRASSPPHTGKHPFSLNLAAR